MRATVIAVALVAAVPVLANGQHGLAAFGGDTRPYFTMMLVMKRAGGHPCFSARFRRPDAGATAPTVRRQAGLFFLNRSKACPSAVIGVSGCPG